MYNWIHSSYFAVIFFTSVYFYIGNVVWRHPILDRRHYSYNYFVQRPNISLHSFVPLYLQALPYTDLIQNQDTSITTTQVFSKYSSAPLQLLRSFMLLLLFKDIWKLPCDVTLLRKHVKKSSTVCCGKIRKLFIQVFIIVTMFYTVKADVEPILYFWR